jgi:hypothetical protein
MTEHGLQKLLPRSPRDNLDWNLSERMKRGLALPAFKDWGFPQPSLDQGATGHCGGFAIAAKRVSPGSKTGGIPQVNADGHAYYYGIKEVEGVKPNDPSYEDGVYTRDAFKYMKKMGWIEGYAFAENLSVAEEFILSQDTLLFGTVWLSDMMEADKDGFVHAGGSVKGGHLWEVRGRDVVKNLWIGQNSWKEWGIEKSGKFYLSDADMLVLFKQAGELGAAVEIPKVPIPPQGKGCVPIAALLAWAKTERNISHAELSAFAGKYQ